MKTPREILLEHHRQADRELESIQALVIARSGRSDAREMPAFIVRKIWSELFYPLRFAWSGFAAVWLVLWAVNLQISGPRPTAMAGTKSESSVAMLMAWKEQDAIMVELTGPKPPPVADRPRATPPKPQSRRETFISIG